MRGETPTLNRVVRELAATVFIFGGAWRLLRGGDCSIYTVYGFQHTYFRDRFFVPSPCLL